MVQNTDDVTHSTYSEKTVIWAHLGYAIMKCQVLEHRLADVLFMCEMLNGDGSWSDKSKKTFQYQKMTMGWLKNRLCETTTLPSLLNDRLEEACEIRNELAHRYFKTRMDLMATKDGYKKIVGELETMYGKIEDVIDAFHKITFLHGAPLGYSAGAIERVRRDFTSYLASLGEAERIELDDRYRRRRRMRRT